MHFNLELRWDGVKSLKQGLQMIRDQAKRTPEGQWIRVVGGWTEHQFDEKRLPTLAELDEAAGKRPVFVLHLYDCALVNRIGLKLLGYSKNTPNPPSGEIVRDADGNPTGVLIARPNAFLLYNTLNMLPKLTAEQAVSSTIAYMRELNRFGVTSVMDPGGGFQNFPDDYSVIQQVDKSNQMTIRIHYSLFPQKPKKELEDFQRWAKMVSPGQGSAFLKHLGAGEMLAFSGADFEDFKEARPDLPHEMEGEMEAIVRFLVSQNWPFRLHATYGESIERFLNVFEKVAKEDPKTFKNLRWFIDHAETISEDDIKRIKALGGGIAIQHRMAFQGEYFTARYGAQAVQNSPPINSFNKIGVPYGAGTDGTRVATYNPWVSLYWLVSGRTVGGSDMSPNKSAAQNKVSRSEALRLWTAANSWFVREEGKSGSIQAGQIADLIVLNTDYFTTLEENIKNIEAELTIVGGKIVYAAPTAAQALGIAPTQQPNIVPSWSPVRKFGGYQITGSKAWTPVPDPSSPDPQSSSTPVDSGTKITPTSYEKHSSDKRNAGQHEQPVDPSKFFQHGEDC
jgi:predicted amidohydrolase YtcJ